MHMCVVLVLSTGAYEGSLERPFHVDRVCVRLSLSHSSMPQGYRRSMMPQGYQSNLSVPCCDSRCRRPNALVSSRLAEKHAVPDKSEVITLNPRSLDGGGGDATVYERDGDDVVTDDVLMDGSCTTPEPRWLALLIGTLDAAPPICAGRATGAHPAPHNVCGLSLHLPSPWRFSGASAVWPHHDPSVPPTHPPALSM